MKTPSFKKLLQGINKLNTQQHRQLREEIQTIDSRKHVSKDLETPSKEVACPHCRSALYFRWGKRNDLQRYKCKECKKTFNSLTGTPLARLRRKGHWLDYAGCIKDGLSVRKAAAVCGIHRNTSFRWRHRFLENIKTIKAQLLTGIVEADEIYFRKSEKGNKQLVRTPRKRGGKDTKQGLSKENICVFISRDRNKNTFDSIFEDFNSSSLKEVFHKHLSTDALFCSDSKFVYKKFTRENSVRHGCLNISQGELIKKDIVHIQNVNSYHSQLRDWIIHRFHGVATKYLDNYVSWYRELDEFSNNIHPLTILLRAKAGGAYKVLPFKVT